MAISTPEPWNSYASWFGTQTGLVIVGTVVMALVVIVSMQPAKRFHTANSVIVGVGLILSALMLPFLGTLDATTFARNLQAITGKSVKDVLDMAAAGGFSVGTYDPTTLGIVLGVALTGFIGFQFSGFLAGELKGNVSRNVLTSMMGACLIGILCQTVFLQAFAGTLGFDFVTALSYLYYGNPSGTPIPAITQAFIAVSSPGLAPLMAISVVGSFLIGFSLCITWVATATRAAFAWAMDRLIPTSLSVINSRTKSPLRLTILFSALWYVFYILSISGVGVLTGIYVSALLALLVWIMPGFNALLLPYRRPELYELIPRSMRKKFGIPLVSILGIISILFTVAVYFMYAVWPLFSGAYGLHGAEVIDYAMSTGSSTFVIVVVAGIILYYASRWYNARHGIDMSLLYKSVPPE
jgi:amino acid transporter